jgi:hypothetical protein
MARKARVKANGGGAKGRRQALTPVPVRFSADELPFYRLVAARAAAQSRSVSGQLKYYARLGMIAEDNPDLPLSFIEGILEAQAELRAGLGQPYHWGVLDGHASTAAALDAQPEARSYQDERRVMLDENDAADSDPLPGAPSRVEQEPPGRRVRSPDH